MLVNHLVGAVGYTPAVASLYNIANAAGSGAGSAVTITITDLVDQYGNGQLPGNGAYTVSVTPSQACFASVSGKTTSGFTVTLTPPSGVTLAAGTVDILVHA